MPSHDVQDHLKTLKLQGMLAQLIEDEQTKPDQTLTRQQWLLNLLTAETRKRQAKSITYQLSIANFPTPKSLSQFDFTQTSIHKTEIEQLHEGGFIDTQRNIILVGGTGTGKSHLATAIGTNVVKQGKRARYYNVVDLVN